MTESTERMTDKPDDQQEASEKERAVRRHKLQALAFSLLQKRDDSVMFRASSGVERRWSEDEEALSGDLENRGEAMMDHASGQAAPTGKDGPNRSQAKINVLRGKCEVARGRFAEVILPVNERNWGFDVTPVVELAKAVGDKRQVQNTATGEMMEDAETGEPVTAADIAKAQMDIAKEKMVGMETEVADQLVECDFQGEELKVIRDAIDIGTGIIKGPIVRKATQRQWVEEKTSDGKPNYVMKVVESQRPASVHVDYRNCYPAPNCNENIRRAPWIWEYDEILPRELASLIGVDGYFDEQIALILTESPLRTKAGMDKPGKMDYITQNAVDKGEAFELWEYHGDVDRDDMLVLGINVGDLKGQSLAACVVFVNERPIKIVLYMVDTGDLIYDFFQWSQVKGSPWGIGVTRQGIWWQRIVQAAWRAMLDNARDSAGANIITGHGVEPADNIWEMTGKKHWIVTDAKVNDVSKVFGQFQVENNQTELQAIIDLAMKFLDIETSLPMLFQGEKTEQVPDVLGIVDVIVDSSNVAIKSRVRIFDNQITKPHLTRYYFWNMEFSPNNDIKGDFKVKALGASVLMARDKTIRALIQAFNMRGDPNADRVTDWDKAYEEFYRLINLDVMKSKEEITKYDEAAQKKAEESKGGEEADPTLVRAETELKKAQMKQEAEMEALKFKAEMQEQDLAIKLQLAVMQRDVKIMEMAMLRDMSVAEIKKELTIEASKQDLQLEMAKDDGKSPQLTEPAVEPEGRAKEGRAYPD